MTVDLVQFNALPDAIRNIGTRRFQRLSRAGQAPPFVRLAPYKPLWSRSAVESWLAEKLRALTPAACTPPALIETFDGEPMP